MIPFDFAELEAIEYEAAIDFFAAAPIDAAQSLAVAVDAIGPATRLTCRELEPASMFRRVVGFGVHQAATEADLDEMVTRMSDLGARYVVPLAPHSQPSEFGSWLEQRGFCRGYAWMKFCRACAAVTLPKSALEIRVVDGEFANEFGAVTAEGFGLPVTMVPWIGSLAGRPDWVCVMAFDGATPVAAGALFLRDRLAWLGFGATLPAHRGRGAQGALLARRLSEAADRGARVAVTETGERLADKPSNSYRNIVRAGFVEAYLRQNYFSPTN